LNVSPVRSRNSGATKLISSEISNPPPANKLLLWRINSTQTSRCCPRATSIKNPAVYEHQVSSIENPAAILSPKSDKQNQKLLLFSPNPEFQSFELWSFKSVPEFVCSAYRKEVPLFGTSADKAMAFHRNSFREMPCRRTPKPSKHLRVFESLWLLICVNQCQSVVSIYFVQICVNSWLIFY
jgi:hypothetical protein